MPEIIAGYKSAMKLPVILFLFFPLFSFSQEKEIYFKVIFDQTREGIPGLEMELGSHCVNSELRTLQTKIVTDCQGVGTFRTINGCTDYSVIPTDWKHYIPIQIKIELEKDTTIIILKDRMIHDLFQEFYFERNSAMVTDTTKFYWWDLIGNIHPSLTIELTGYYAPGETKDIAYKRAQAVYDGFMQRGAKPGEFTLNVAAYPDFQLPLKYSDTINGTEQFFKKGQIMYPDYIKTLSGDRKLAAEKVLMAVRLAWKERSLPWIETLIDCSERYVAPKYGFSNYFPMLYNGPWADTLSVTGIGFLYPDTITLIRYQPTDEPPQKASAANTLIEFNLANQFCISEPVGFGEDTMVYHSAFAVVIRNTSGKPILVGNNGHLNIRVQFKKEDEWITTETVYDNYLVAESQDIIIRPDELIVTSFPMFLGKRDILRFVIGDEISKEFELPTKP